MHIALVRKEYLEYHGGAERYATLLARGLARRRHQVSVFSGTFQSEPHPGIQIRDVPYIPKPSALKNYTFQRNVRRRLQKYSFDIVCGLSQVYPQDVYRMGDGLHVCWLTIGCTTPLQRLACHLSPRHRVIVSIERSIFSKGNYRLIIANSALCAQQAMRHYGVEKKSLRLVRNGVDPGVFNTGIKQRFMASARKHFNMDAGTVVLLFAGHNFKRKGLRHALEFAAALKNYGCRIGLLIAGRGGSKGYRLLAERLGLVSDSVLLGAVSDMLPLYAAADLLVHPAHYDPFSNVCLEAMACGVPVLTTRQNGAAEIVRDGTSGFIVAEPRQAASAAGPIAGMLEKDRSALQAIGVSAANAAGGYTIDRNVDETLSVFRQAQKEKASL